MAGSTNFPTSLDSFGDVSTAVFTDDDDINDLRRAVEAIEAKVGIDSSNIDTSIDYKVNNFFVEGVRTLWLYEASAPTGWTLQDYGDKVLAVGKTGKLYDGQLGATNTDDWTISGLTMDAHTHTDGTYSSPSHNHSHSHPTGADHDLANGNYYGESAKDNAITLTGGASGVSGDSGPQSDNVITSDGTWRPSAYIGVIVQYTGA